MVITVTLNPALDRTVNVSRLVVNGVNRVESDQYEAGGKGINISKLLHELGSETLAMGVLGGETGMYIKQYLDRRSIPNDFCFVEAPTRTNLKLVDTSMHTTTDINEKGEPIPEAVLKELFERLKSHVKPGDYVVFAGTNPAKTPEELIARWSEELTALGASVLLDTTGRPLKNALAARPVLIKPNRYELEEICERRLFFDVDIIVEAKNLIEEGAGSVVVSMGSEGAIFVTADSVIRAYAPKVPVYRTNGSGDVMLGALCYALENKMEWRDAVLFSMAASSAHVSRKKGDCMRSAIELLKSEVRMDELM